MTVVLVSCSIVQNQSTTPAANVPTMVTTETPVVATPTGTNLPPPQDWQYRWLKKIPCGAPCLEGITPGKTTASEAMEILSQNPLVKNVRREPSYGYKWESVSWNWVVSGQTGDAFYPHSNSETIITITPHFGMYYSFRDVVQAYGEPTHIVAIARQLISERPTLCQEARFVYVPYGLELRSDCNSKLELNENISFLGASFFIPTREGYESIDETARRHPDWMIPWQGFKGFEYYCRDEQGGKLCRGEFP